MNISRDVDDEGVEIIIISTVKYRIVLLHFSILTCLDTLNGHGNVTNYANISTSLFKIMYID